MPNELPFETLLEATGQLDSSQVEALSQRLSEVRRLQKKQALQEELAQIKQRYEDISLSQAQWQRYHELLEVRRKRNMNEAEADEWHQLAQRNEELSVARLSLLSEFGHRHKLSLAEVMRRLKIKAPEAVVV